MRLPVSAPLLRRWPLLGLAALISLIVLATLLTGPPVAEATGGHDGGEEHVHLSPADPSTPFTCERAACTHAPTGFASPGPGEGQITVAWTPATTGPAATHWVVWWAADNGGTFSELIDDASARSLTVPTPRVDPSLDVNDTYIIRVQGAVSASNNDWGAAADAYPVRPYDPPPVVSSATVNGTTLTMTFDKDLDTGSAPAGSAFTVSADATHHSLTNRTIAGTGTAAISGRTATVTLANAVHPFDIVRVGYAKPTSNPLQNGGGFDTINFTNRGVTNDTPDLAGATVNGKVLTLTFNYALDENSGSGSNFRVETRHGGAIPVVGMSISGKTVTLTLAETIPSHSGTSLRYSRPAWDALFFKGIDYPVGPIYTHVRVETQDSAPVFSSATLRPYYPPVWSGCCWRCLPTWDEKAYLWVHFNELLDEDAVPPGSAFRVTARPPGGSARTVLVNGDVVIDGSVVRMELGPVPGGQDAQITLSYTPPTSGADNKLKDGSGNLTERFSGKPVTNGPPRIESMALVSDPGGDRTYGLGEQVRVRVTFDGPVSVVTRVTTVTPFVSTRTAVPRLKIDLDPASWGEKWATYEGGSETDTLTFVYTVADSDISTQGIAVAPNAIDLNGSKIGSVYQWPREAADLTHPGLGHNRAHKVDAALPSFQSATVDWKTLQMTFTVDLDGDTVPSPGAFRVTANGARRNVAAGGVAVSGKTVTLALTSAISPTDTVQVRYTKPSRNGLQGRFGSAVNTFSYQAVTNNTQATIWSATLTVGPAVLGGDGCWTASGPSFPTPCSSALTDNSFTYDGITYQVTRVVRQTHGITNEPIAVLELDKAIPSDVALLYVGDHQLPVADATLSDGDKTAIWTNPGFNWTVNQKVSLRLTESASKSDSSSASGDSGGEPASATDVTVISSAGADKTYGLGDTIHVRVTFDETVDVTGTPRLKIDMDPAEWGEKWAAYQGGSGTSSLTFAHTVVEPNISTQGIAVLENSLELNGGTMQSDGLAALLAHTGLAHDFNHKVDWQTEPETGGGPTGTSDPPGGRAGTAEASRSRAHRHRCPAWKSPRTPATTTPTPATT